jgi:lycopene beta-cyclase
LSNSDANVDYDYIICGGGASGLMLAYRLCTHIHFKDHKILIIDKSEKNENDRTWCFWERGAGEWDHLVSKSWNKIYFGSSSFSKQIIMDDYSYKMIKGIDFYTHIKSILAKKVNVRFVKAGINKIVDIGSAVQVQTEAGDFIGRKAFNSIFNPSIVNNQSGYAYLKQHFVGLFIKAETPVFDPTVATFMDFDIPQKGNTRFMYVLPSSSTEALIEYTLFSPDLLKYEEYLEEIEKFIHEQIGIYDYTIVDRESGNIPMTCYPFHKQNTNNILHIGSAGGWTKASTGYTFRMSSKYSASLLKFLIKSEELSRFHKKNRYWYYDLIFLDVLNKHNEKGHEVFASIFKNHKLEKIFRFLDEEASLLEDLSIMQKTKPMSEFIKSAFTTIKYWK